MNLIDLYNLQQKLDSFMMETHGLTLTDEIKNKRYIALKVEISEFINDIQDFKYWKRNNKPKKTALEEGTDVLHFILSVAIMNGWDKMVSEIHPVLTDQSITTLTIELEQNRFKSASDYIEGFNKLLQILNRLGYTEDQIIEAYVEKNLINYQRQKEFY